MIEITNGVKTKVVTKGVFHEIYEKEGWEKTDGLAEKRSETVELPIKVEKGPENVAEEPEKVDQEEVEIPLSEMTVSELRAFAKKHNIDVSRAKNERGLRAIITTELEG